VHWLWKSCSPLSFLCCLLCRRLLQVLPDWLPMVPLLGLALPLTLQSSRRPLKVAILMRSNLLGNNILRFGPIYSPQNPCWKKFGAMPIIKSRPTVTNSISGSARAPHWNPQRSPPLALIACGRPLSRVIRRVPTNLCLGPTCYHRDGNCK
jgi:hypothetical protein